MRGKIIAVFSVIVLVVGLLAFALMSARLGDIVANPDQARPDAMRSATVANAALKLEALTFERWLDEQSNDPALREPFLRENPQSRSDEATTQADRVFGQASKSFGTPPTLVAVVDAEGVVMGRNGSTLMRADNTGYRRQTRRPQGGTRSLRSSDRFARSPLAAVADPNRPYAGRCDRG